MAQLSDEKKEQARAMFALGKSINFVARELKISTSTSKKIKDALDKDDGFKDQRAKCKEGFIKEAWEVVMIATKQAKIKLPEAGAGEAAKVAGIFYDKIALATGEATSRGELTGKDGKPIEVTVKLEDYFK